MSRGIPQLSSELELPLVYLWISWQRISSRPFAVLYLKQECITVNLGRHRYTKGRLIFLFNFACACTPLQVQTAATMWKWRNGIDYGFKMRGPNSDSAHVKCFFFFLSHFNDHHRQRRLAFLQRRAGTPLVKHENFASTLSISFWLCPKVRK